MPRDRQQYNFLAALLGQLDRAKDAGDDLWHDWRAGLQEDLEDVFDRLDKLEQWLAQLDPEVGADLEEGSNEPDEDAQGDASSDADHHVGTVGPTVDRGGGRTTRAVARPRGTARRPSGSARRGALKRGTRKTTKR